jgi:hypothetical protein
MSVVATEIAKFRSSSMAQNAGWLFAGQGLGLVLQAGYFVLLARLLGPLQYGIYAGAFAFASLVAQYSALGTGTVFLRYVSSDHSAFDVYWGNILVVTSVVGGGLVVALDLLGSRLLNPASAALVLLAAIGRPRLPDVREDAVDGPPQPADQPGENSWRGCDADRYAPCHSVAVGARLHTGFCFGRGSHRCDDHIPIRQAQV